MRISDWSSDVCSSDLRTVKHGQSTAYPRDHHLGRVAVVAVAVLPLAGAKTAFDVNLAALFQIAFDDADQPVERYRSEEHTSELQSLMRISYAVFCLKKKTNDQ